jgi:hypothetical protein
MKKTPKKLKLAKETVRELDGAGVQQARGRYGDPNYSAQGGCIVTATCTGMKTYPDPVI